VHSGRRSAFTRSSPRHDGRYSFLVQGPSGSRTLRLASTYGFWLADCAPRRAHRRGDRWGLGSWIARLPDGTRQRFRIHRSLLSHSSAGGGAAFSRCDSRTSRGPPADTKKPWSVVAFLADFNID